MCFNIINHGLTVFIFTFLNPQNKMQKLLKPKFFDAQKLKNRFFSRILNHRPEKRKYAKIEALF